MNQGEAWQWRQVRTERNSASPKTKRKKESYFASAKSGALVLNVADLGFLTGELPEAEEAFLHGRMDIESNDYTPSANTRHDPKPPKKG
ncbi:hypothetical protein Taro_045842 [Colocasia esculenta]|uniref:Uncharacterized protein n=1 Tax=Colocasia esculenta TaxID=4460 RepID=A0A843WQK9_COLES|nr:hypothetical protein [Colocasia esculenta]